MSTPDPYNSGQPDRPGAPTPPPAGPQPGAYPGQAPAAPQYPQGQPVQGYGQPPQENPGKTLGIVGFVLAFLGPLSIVGLILSIVGLRKSKKAGFSNGLALAGIIVGGLAVVGFIILAVVLGVGLSHVAEVCNDLGPGTHVQGGVTYTCG